MPLDQFQLASLYRRAHDLMRNIDGLQPQEAFDELLKYLFFKVHNEERGPSLLPLCQGPDERSLWGGEQEIISQVRELFSDYLRKAESWTAELWPERAIHLSDLALGGLHHLLQSVSFRTIDFDIRSAALKEFLSSDLRRGLGIYLTPDDVVRMMVATVLPAPKAIVYDPACGSGTFLLEVMRHQQRKLRGRRSSGTVWGTDINPRMLLLAELNLGHVNGTRFEHRLCDALALPTKKEWPAEAWCDMIFTNPPFGVILAEATHNLRAYKTSLKSSGELVSRQQSEVVFLEQCLRYLKPGGVLSIVLPKSIITNESVAYAREVIDTYGHVFAAVSLPPETFRTTGTQTTTSVLYFRKFRNNEKRDRQIRIAYVDITNVGFDYTGRPREGNQLLAVAPDIRSALRLHRDSGLCRLLAPINIGQTLSGLRDLLAPQKRTPNGIVLGDVVELACTGKTPPRASYSDKGLFLVKVGNLTGSGINWIARERNYVGGKEAENRRKANARLMVARGDVLLTSSAHSPVYIAKKVDIITSVPDWVGGEASFVGEVMLLRARPEAIDPFALLIYLRLPKTTALIQQMIRGQTAHLRPNDILGLEVPRFVTQPTRATKKVIENLMREASLNAELNDLSNQQQQLLASLENGRF